MSPTPELRRKPAAPGVLALLAALVLAVPTAPRAAAQATASSAPPPEQSKGAKPIQLAAPPPPQDALSAPPVAPPAAAPSNAPSAVVAPSRSTAAKSKPPPKSITKPGPGANDAGKRAITLHTTKLPLFGLIDRSVVGRQKREIGHVVDVLVDAKGEPAALVVDVGGFMGVGNRRIAIGWERFALAGRKTGDALQIPFSDAQIKAAPADDGAREVSVVQGASEPPAASASLPPSRVSLGEDLGPLSTDKAAPANSLNPD